MDETGKPQDGVSETDGAAANNSSSADAGRIRPRRGLAALEAELAEQKDRHAARARRDREHPPAGPARAR